MARRPRSSIPGAIYHVMLRGNNKNSIFSSDAERCRFCLLMQEGVERYGHRILAFCFMSNHVHLAIQLGKVSLSKICQNLSFRYTGFYNRRHQRIGHLFQGRFKSILVDGKSYLKELIRYIHLNPVRAKMVNDPLKYRWSSHRAYLMKDEFTWLEKDVGLQNFGDSRHLAMEKFHHFVLSGIGQNDGIDFKKGMSEGIVGDKLFIDNILDETTCDENDEPATIDLDILNEVVTNWYGVDKALLQKPGIDRKLSHIRSVMALLARYTEGVSLRELAVHCNRADNTMSQAAGRLKTLAIQSEALKSEYEGIKAELLSVAAYKRDQLKEFI